MFKIEKKSIAKSLRMKPSIYQYIENQEGNGFNEKFEKLIENLIIDEQKILYRKECLVKEIEKLEMEVNDLRSYIYIAKSVKRDLEEIQGKTNKIEEIKCNTNF